MTNEPKIVRSTWANVYAVGISVGHVSPHKAWRYRYRKKARCIAVLRRDFYDDGTCVPTLEEV